MRTQTTLWQLFGLCTWSWRHATKRNKWNFSSHTSEGFLFYLPLRFSLQTHAEYIGSRNAGTKTAIILFFLGRDERKIPKMFVLRFFLQRGKSEIFAFLRFSGPFSAKNSVRLINGPWNCFAIERTGRTCKWRFMQVSGDQHSLNFQPWMRPMPEITAEPRICK